MEIKDTYRTIDSPSEGIFKDKGSKFLSFAYHIEDESEVKQLLTDIKKRFFDARHHCYAYRIGTGTEERYRTNDDGEPTGTAGKPIYGQLLSNDLTNILVIVVRYFGGTKLGVPGLINAYREATKDAIINNTVTEKVIYSALTIEFAYPMTNIAMKLFKDESVDICEEKYDNDLIEITVKCRMSRTDTFKQKINNIFGLTIKT
ncbi:MAG: IMPACT family protein [Bacteroidales bacterium]|nr:IMPACT family protein [Bacteroidales bacterium]